MYLDYEVAIPNMPGKITYDKKKDSTYVKYEYGRTYDAGKKYTYVQRATIGKQSGKDASKMYPNANFIKYFPNAELPQTKEQKYREQNEQIMEKQRELDRLLNEVLNDEMKEMLQEIDKLMQEYLRIFLMILSLYLNSVWEKYFEEGDNNNQQTQGNSTWWT